MEYNLSFKTVILIIFVASLSECLTFDNQAENKIISDCIEQSTDTTKYLDEKCIMKLNEVHEKWTDERLSLHPFFKFREICASDEIVEFDVDEALSLINWQIHLAGIDAKNNEELQQIRGKIMKITTKTQIKSPKCFHEKWYGEIFDWKRFNGTSPPILKNEFEVNDNEDFCIRKMLILKTKLKSLKPRENPKNLNSSEINCELEMNAVHSQRLKKLNEFIENLSENHQQKKCLEGYYLKDGILNNFNFLYLHEYKLNRKQIEILRKRFVQGHLKKIEILSECLKK